MGLKLHNTLTRTKDEFRPIDANNVRMYVCGPTVYDFAHIGNARPLIVFDVLYRLLRHLYGPEHVTYVRNITDVDDKINARAGAEHPELPLNEAIRKVTEVTERQFHEDADALGCLRPTFEPRATENIDQMRTLIDTLIARRFAYVAEDHVLFHVASMPDYGQLSHRSLDDMIAGARVEIAPYKRDPMDFVLWKPSKPGEPSWPSPKGVNARGRPGWHIECSAMAARYLQQTFDIHGGGIDLVFPHHENEIAQSRCAFGTHVMANYWLHNGFLQVEGQKMSKSLGNFVTIRELRQSWKGHPWPGESLRLNMLRSHYRQPMDWTVEGLDESHGTLWDWYAVIEKESVPLQSNVPEEVINALADDLNTPKMLTELHRFRASGDLASLFASLRFLGFSGNRQSILRHYQDELGPAELKLTGGTLTEAFSGTFVPGAPANPSIFGESQAALMEARYAARKAKNFAEADRIRIELDAMGIALKDSKDPKTGELVTTWEVKR